MQAAFERCLAFCPIKQKIQEICEITLVGQTARTPMPFFNGLGSAPRLFANLLKITTSSLVLVFRRTVEETLMSCQSTIYILQYMYCSWFYDKSEEISINSHCIKMKFSIKDFFSKCDHIRRKLRIWSHLLKKSLKKNFIFVQCLVQKIEYLGVIINSREMT